MDTNFNTRITLIQRAKSQWDEHAWNEFAHYYRRFIYYVLNSMKVSNNDIDDLAQNILLKLWEKLPMYEKQRARFRAWLATIIRNAVISFYRKEKIKDVELHPNDFDSVCEPELDKIIEQEWQNHITSIAMERIEKAYRGNAITVFKMTLAGKSTEEISKELNLTTDSVYTLRNRVKTSFVNEVKGLISELEL